MKLIALSYPSDYKDEHSIINTLFSSGLEILHLRKPNCNINQMISLLDKIDAKFYNRIVIHSHYELCNDYSLKGIHFTHKTRHLIEKYKDSPIHKSISCHDFIEVLKYRDTMNYCFISPVFDSISKVGYRSNISLDELSNYSKETNLVALGGINSDNIQQVKQTKLYGAAILGYLWQSIDVQKAFKEIQTQICNEEYK